MNRFTLSRVAALALLGSGCADDVSSQNDASTGTSTSTGDTPNGSTSTTGVVSSFTTAESGNIGTLGTTTGEDEGSEEETGPAWDCPDPAPAGGDVSLIDDMEGHPIVIPSLDGRAGTWFNYSDETNGMLSPQPYSHTRDDAHGGEWAAHTVGEGFFNWGAALAVSLNSASGRDCHYDASAYEGITFWARGTGLLRVHFSTRQTVPYDQGGLCSAGNGCWDNYGTGLELTPTWEPYVITWEELSREGWGIRTEFDPAEIFYIHWQYQGDDAFDIWIDDLNFYPADDVGGSESGSESEGDASSGESTSGTSESDATSGTSESDATSGASESDATSGAAESDATSGASESEATSDASERGGNSDASESDGTSGNGFEPR